MVIIKMSNDQFNELYDSVKDLPDQIRSDYKESGDELDAAHKDLFDAVKILKEIAEKWLLTELLAESMFALSKK